MQSLPWCLHHCCALVWVSRVLQGGWDAEEAGWGYATVMQYLCLQGWPPISAADMKQGTLPSLTPQPGGTLVCGQVHLGEAVGLRVLEPVGLFPTAAKIPSWELGETFCQEAAALFLTLRR